VSALAGCLAVLALKTIVFAASRRLRPAGRSVATTA
jgi:hypothetical protein